MNVEKRWRTNASLAATLICIALAGRADAAVVSYTIDPLRSSLTLSGDLGGTPLFHKVQEPRSTLTTAPSSATWSLACSLSAVGARSSPIRAAGGPFLPAVGGTVDNYGMETTTGFYGLGYYIPAGPLAFRDVAFDIATGSLSDGVLPALVDISVTGTVASAYLGTNPLGGNGIWHPISAAGLTTTSGIETLTLPFQRSRGWGASTCS